MADLSRRKLLTTGSLGALAGVAAMTGAGKLPELLGAATGGRTEPDLSPAGADVVAHVSNASTGEVTVMVGTHEAVQHDPELVGRLLSIARRASQRS